MNWRDGVVYQIYPRSFQDSDGDGIGDLAGISARLDHLRDLGVDAAWLSPIYPSPLADFGYDVSDHSAVDPVYGTLADFDVLVSAAHGRGLKVLMDLVACHTSIEHPWFREHPDWFVWSPVDGAPNNWVSAFGGPAWSRDERSGRWYLHSFYPEQPDLNWHNPEVIEAMQAVVRFWIARGVDGFRIDAIDRLMKDPELRDDGSSDEPFGLWLLEHELGRDLSRSRNWHEIGKALGAIREAAGDALLVGEVYLPARRHATYLEHLDRAFVFELLQTPWELGPVRAAVEAGSAAPRARRGCSRTTTSAACHRASVVSTSAPRRCCCSRCPAPHSSTRVTRSGLRTARATTRRMTGSAGMHFAIRCSGSRPRTVGSRRGGPGSRSATRRSGASPRSSPTGTRRSRTGSS